MSKIPAGVGPKLPQVVVLFGATGDLSQRKLLPGLFHLITARFIPKCRIIGVSLDDITTDDFRTLARKAIEMHHDHPPAESDWPALDAALDYVPIKQGPKALAAAVQRAAEVARRQFPARQLPQRAAERGAVGSADARRGGPRQGLAGDHGEAVRDRPRQRGRAQHRVAQGVRRRARSSASTIFSARSRRRTSWPSASATGCSSRSGTAISSITCRSTSPRRWISAIGSASTSRPAPFATWS